MIGSANDRRTYLFKFAAKKESLEEKNLTGADGITSGYAIIKPVPFKRSDEYINPNQNLLEEAYKRKQEQIKRMSETVFQNPMTKSKDFITEFGASSQHSRKKHEAQRNNYYYKLAYSRKINPSRAFRSKKLFY